MATRLYPLTKNKASIEKMAGVPEGTHAKLDEIESRYSEMRGDEFHHTIHADSNVGALYNFILFGWGRVQWPINECYGSTTEPELVANMLCEQGECTQENLQLCEGLCWN